MQKHSSFHLRLLGLLSLITLSTFSLLGKQEDIKASAWSGTQTSSAGSYYNSVSTETGENLKLKLRGIISSGTSESYDWGRYEAADEAEGQSSKVLLVYTRTTMAKTAHVSGSQGWNREHSFPQSKIGAPATSDNHHIFASDNKVNGTRGNKQFGVVPTTSANQVKDSLGNLTDNYTTSTYFYPTAAARGEVARATMYINTRYTYSVTANFASVELMLQWHLENPVTNREIYRNNTVHTLQKNRNPYIDHPEYACLVYGETNAATRSLCSQTTVNPESVSLNPASGTVNMGSTLTLGATVLPSGAPQAVTWTSANNSIATVSNGIVTPVSVGEVLITATSTTKNTVKASALITVTNTPVAVTGVSFNRQSGSVAINSTLALVATVTPTNASNKTVSFISSQPSIASVNAQGVVTGLQVGTSTITVTTQDGNFSDTCLITVTNVIATTSITGSFYNTSSSNSGGENGVTVANLNNGISSVNATGFAGNNVIKAVKTVTQGYYPRSSGLALGSSGNPGILVLELEENYYATKVEAKFNNASVADTTATLSGNSPIKSQVTGTIGTVNSHPSDGNGYVTEFTNPASEITINTSKRTALVELIIHYGSASVIDTSVEDATSWALDFLELTEAACLNQSAIELSALWSQASDSFNILSTEAKAIISNTIPNGDGDAIEEAVARYVVIVTNYQLIEFIPGVLITQPTRTVYQLSREDQTFTIIGGLTLLALVGGFIVIDKKLKSTR